MVCRHLQFCCRISVPTKGIPTVQRETSIRSSNFVIQYLEAAVMDQLGWPKKCLIEGSIGPPFSETLINSSPPAKNAKKQE
ncbi:hypothetical protein CR513_29730, partial [Mucuna pruriens]